MITNSPKHEELERKKRNLHKVYNPTNHDFKVVFNAAVSPETWIIRAHEEEIVPEYVCKKYLKEMSNQILQTQSKEKIDKENERRTNAGMQPMNLHSEQPMFESKTYKITEDQYVQMMAQLYRGLHKEYGLDVSPDQSPLIQGSSKPAFESALQKIFNGDLPVESEPKTAPKPVKPTKTEEVVIDTSNSTTDIKSKIDAEIQKISSSKKVK